MIDGSISIDVIDILTYLELIEFVGKREEEN